MLFRSLAARLDERQGAQRAFFVPRRGRHTSSVGDGSADVCSPDLPGTLWPVAPVEACLERIRALDGTLEAWVHVDEKGALAVARERARESARAAVRGPLHGIPFAVKDIFDVAGLPTTAGARAFAHRRPGEDAASVALLRAAGAIVLGKTHT